MMRMSPDFFIIGSPKAGTTALYAYLAGHPQVCMSSDKEPNYFSGDQIAAQGLYYKKKNPKTLEEYLQLFQPKKGNKISGECSVSYLFYPGVAEKIYQFNPKAKIIISLRDPVHRAFSHYLMDYSLHLVKESFDKIVLEGEKNDSLKLYYQQYILLSQYTEQIKRYLNVFPKDQVLIFIHDDLVSRPEEELKRLSAFLEIEHEVSGHGLEQRNVTTAAKSPLVRWLYKQEQFRKFLAYFLDEKTRGNIKSKLFSKKHLPVLSLQAKEVLKALYKPEIPELEKITGKSLQHWCK
ncbi:MAG: sulfotransferase [Bacteroidetes bacterium]|nr:sulfotransferase [Bacteroidota bacterium]